MGKFIWDGKNALFQDFINNLPQSVAYSKDGNVIPYINEVTYVQTIPQTEYPINTPVKFYVNDQLVSERVTLPTQNIYVKIKPPYKKFTIKTVIDNETYREETYYSLNLFAFFTVLSKVMNYDYRQIFNLFGNIWNIYLQDDEVYSKLGWYYNFGKPYGWTAADYRQVLVGDTPGTPPFSNPLRYKSMNEIFLNAMTIDAIKQVVRNFTHIEPDIISYRDIDGWLLPNDQNVDMYTLNIYDPLWVQEFKRYYTYEDAETPVIDLQNDETILYSEQYHNNTIQLICHNASKQIVETVTRGNGLRDTLKHKYILNTVSHPISVNLGGTIYTYGADFTLEPNIDDSTLYDILWSTTPSITIPALYDDYTVTYNYLMEDEIKLFSEMVKPASLAIEYTFNE